MRTDRQQFRIALAQSRLNTQLELARVTRIHRSRLSLIFNGWTAARDEEKQSIASALGVPVDRIFPAEQHEGHADAVAIH